MALHFRAFLVAGILISSASVAAEPVNSTRREITLDSSRVALDWDAEWSTAAATANRRPETFAFSTHDPAGMLASISPLPANPSLLEDEGRRAFMSGVARQLEKRSVEQPLTPMKLAAGGNEGLYVRATDRTSTEQPGGYRVLYSGLVVLETRVFQFYILFNDEHAANEALKSISRMRMIH